MSNVDEAIDEVSEKPRCKVQTIEFVVNDETIRLSIADAKDLQGELNRLFLEPLYDSGDGYYDGYDYDRWRVQELAERNSNWFAKVFG